MHSSVLIFQQRVRSVVSDPIVMLGLQTQKELVNESRVRSLYTLHEVRLHLQNETMCVKLSGVAECEVGRDAAEVSGIKLGQGKRQGEGSGAHNSVSFHLQQRIGIGSSIRNAAIRNTARVSF